MPYNKYAQRLQKKTSVSKINQIKTKISKTGRISKEVCTQPPEKICSESRSEINERIRETGSAGYLFFDFWGKKGKNLTEKKG